MPEFEGYKIVYEVMALPRGKWSSLVEIIRRQDGEVLAPRHNPFQNHPFDTKLEALDQVNQYIETVLAEAESESKLRRIA
ncbi:hypothetical protein AWV80_37235 [Cupriavidus sp. UYMU48A]|nr:hypothetical protein AWV80_37235 [Cupriavidus sp. UYMU48A]